MLCWNNQHLGQLILVEREEQTFTVKGVLYMHFVYCLLGNTKLMIVLINFIAHKLLLRKSVF